MKNVIQLPSIVILFYAAATLLVDPSTALAHGLGVEAKRVGDSIRVEGFYDDDTPAANATVIVTRGEEEIARGVADEKGVWLFTAPVPGTYSIRLDAGDGHRAATTITITATAIASDGPTRQEFTAFPWLGLVAGLTIIALAALLLRWRARLKSPKRSPQS